MAVEKGQQVRGHWLKKVNNISVEWSVVWHGNQNTHTYTLMALMALVEAKYLTGGFMSLFKWWLHYYTTTLLQQYSLYYIMMHDALLLIIAIIAITEHYNYYHNYYSVW